MSGGDPPGITFRGAAAADLGAVQEVEVRAALRFLDVGWPSVAATTPTGLAQLATAAGDGRLLVACLDGAVVGFALMSTHPDAAHLDELDVLPEAGRRGIGRALVERTAAWARARGQGALTLTTFRDIPWNGPFYASARVRHP